MNNWKFKKIAAFGASVTEQEDSYADQLSKNLGIKIRKYGYGGMHLPDAGVCFIDKVLSCKPEICLVDWFSTAYMECSEKTLQCIDTILYKFSRSNCVVVFLILPTSRSDERKKEREKYYDFLRNALKLRNAYIIDIDSVLKTDDLSNILKDSIHTTKKGGGYYADIIQREIKLNPPYLVNAELFAVNAKYKDIKKIRVNRVFLNQIRLDIAGEIIGIYNIIGRNSGVCRISTDGVNEKKVLLWDRWCHYERNHFDFSIPQYHGTVNIEVLQDEFDTSTCKVTVDFKKYRKQIVCRDIYWIGTSLSVQNVSSGSRIALLKIVFMQQFRKMKHFVAKKLNRVQFLRVLLSTICY